jgi:hypothetical protein
MLPLDHRNRCAVVLVTQVAKLFDVVFLEEIRAMTVRIRPVSLANILSKKLKVKSSRKRPGVAQRFPGCLDSQIS